MLFFRSISVILCASLYVNVSLVVADDLTRNYKKPLKQAYVFAKNRPSPEMVDLGRFLFFDVRLSGNNTMSCATCHQPDKYWSDGRDKGIGHNGKKLEFSTPTLINAAYNLRQFWDGRVLSLEQQSTLPIQSVDEMNQDMDSLIVELNNISGYVEKFENVFGEKRITAPNISRSIAAFERSLISNNTDFDRWYNGNENAISESAKRGFELFENKAKCVDCHSGFNFNDNKFHNIGLKSNLVEKNGGRFRVTKRKIHKNSFRTPTLRNVMKTAPYMHNGSIKTIEEVIDFYNRGGEITENIDDSMKKLNLTKTEILDLIAFLDTLNELILVKIPQKFPQ